MADTRKRKRRAQPATGVTNGPVRLDEIDRAIVELLQSNGRMTNTELARRVGVSPPSTLERVRKLEHRGVIRGYAALVSPQALNKATTALVSVTLREHGRVPLQRVREQMAALDEVQACWHIAGEEDFLLKVVVTDMQAYQEFVTNKLSDIRAIGRIKTAFVLNTWKDQTLVPLDAAAG